MARIKIKELVSKESKTNGNQYVIVKDTADQKYFCWTPEIFAGLKVGDEIEITTTAGKNDAVYITAVEKVSAEPTVDYDEDDIPDPDFDIEPEPVPVQRQSSAQPIQRTTQPRPIQKSTPAPVQPATNPTTRQNATQRPTVAPAPQPIAKRIAPVVTEPIPDETDAYSDDCLTDDGFTIHEDYAPDTDVVTTPNMEIYNKGKTPPAAALKPFDNGRFKGTDINPMWRIKKLTEIYGPVGIGWYYTIDSKVLVDCEQTKETKAFVDISLYVKDPSTGEWSKPIAGTGGNSFCVIGKKGPVCNDDCYKSATTDALGNACKSIGIGADIYWQEGATKYNGN